MQLIRSGSNDTPSSLPTAGLDAVLIHSVIDATPSPKSLLARMGGARGMVKENGGLVVVVSAYDWNHEVTPRGSWLGGYLDSDGNKVSAVQPVLQDTGGDHVCEFITSQGMDDFQAIELLIALHVMP